MIEKKKPQHATPIYFPQTLVVYREISRPNRCTTALGRVFKDGDEALTWATKQQKQLKPTERVCVVPEEGRLEVYTRDSGSFPDDVVTVGRVAYHCGLGMDCAPHSDDVKKYAPHFLAWLRRRRFLTQAYAPIALLSARTSPVVYANWLWAVTRLISIDEGALHRDLVLLHPFGLLGPQFLCLSVSSQVWESTSLGEDLVYGYNQHVDKCPAVTLRIARRKMLQTERGALRRINLAAGGNAARAAELLDALAALPHEVEQNYMQWDPLAFNTPEQIASVL